MKKIFVLVAILLTSLFTVRVNAKSVDLESIKDAFNNHPTVAEMKEYGFEWEAFYDETEPNILSISQKTSEGNTMVSYELNGNILGYTHLVEETFYTGMILTDSIAKLNGYEYGEFIENSNLFGEEISKYTLENEGFEIKENNSYYELRIDITKKIPLIDISNFYYKPEEFDIIADLVEEESVGNQSGINGNFAYDLVVGVEENEITFAEKEKITNSSYKSILSALEVMYGKDVVDYFKEMYPSFEEGSLITDGFDIDYDVEIEDEDSMFYGMKVVRVKVDNKYIDDLFFREEYIGEEVQKGDKILNINFTKDKSYKLGAADSASATDAGFLYKYIIEPLYETVQNDETELQDNEELTEDIVAYFNIVDGKVVIADEENSIFKIIYNSEDFSLEMLPMDTESEKTTVTAIHKNVIVKEYQECEYAHIHYKNGVYGTVTVNITYGQEVEYEVLEGEGQKIDTSKEDTLSFKIDMDYDLFLEEGKVYVDDKLVDAANYTTEKGSTILTFKKEFVKKLGNGTHNLRVEVNNGSANATFNVTGIVNPQTNDTVLTYIALLIVSIVGLLGLSISRKRIMN